MSFELQNIDLFTPYLAIVVLAINVFILTVLIFAMAYFFKKTSLSREEAEQIKNKAREEAEAFLDNSRKEALKIIGDARIKSEEMLRNVKSFVDGSEEKLQKAIDDFSRQETERLLKASEKFTAVYESSVNAAAHRHLNDLDNIFQGISKTVDQGVAEFQKVLSAEVKKSHEDADRRISEWHENSLKEIEEYKKEALRGVDSAVYKVLALVSKEVIGKTLDMETHRGLILRALETAKKEGFFNND